MMHKKIYGILTVAIAVGAIGGIVVAKYTHFDSTSAHTTAAASPLAQVATRPAGSGSEPGQVRARPAEQPATQPIAGTSPDLTPYCRVMNFGQQPPQFAISLANKSDIPAVVNSVTIVGYSSGAEIGSTIVNIGDVITPEQNMVFWANLPEGWYTDTSYPPTDDKPDTYTAVPDSCQVLWYN